MSDHWCCMPFVNGASFVEQATLDLLAQSLPTRVLLIGQGASEADSDRLRVFVEQHHPRVLLWSWNPALPSLSAVWNRALAFVWELGGTEALVVNNDVRLHADTYRPLLEVLDVTGSLFVSAVGVREEQFDPAATLSINGDAHGGPDFSCFVISHKGHERYPFDENFRPSYGEDVDTHRRYMLAGDGSRIFSVNLPYLHYASGTLKEYTPEERSRFNKAYAACMAYYARKWGGPPNHETLASPFGLYEPSCGAAYIATPDLQARYSGGLRPCDDTQFAPGADPWPYNGALAALQAGVSEKSPGL